MKIGIIANSIDDIKTGVTSYPHNLIKNIHYIGYKNRYVIIHHSNSEFINGIKSKFDFIDDCIIPIPNIAAGHEMQKMILTPIKLKKMDFDIVHDTYHFGPFLFLKKPKKILTVHDLTPLLYPNTHKKSKILIHKYLFPLILKYID